MLNQLQSMNGAGLTKKSFTENFMLNQLQSVNGADLTKIISTLKIYVKPAPANEWSWYNKNNYDFENFLLNQLQSMNGSGLTKKSFTENCMLSHLQSVNGADLTKIISTFKIYVKPAPVEEWSWFNKN